MSGTIRSATTSQSKRMAHESWLSQAMKHMSKINPNKKSTIVIPLPNVKLNENSIDDCEDDQ